jgi:hypothetical protein
MSIVHLEIGERSAILALRIGADLGKSLEVSESGGSDRRRRHILF